MAGPWSATNPPPRPGGYVNWRALSQPVIPPNLAGIVCVPFVHNWGPYKVPVLSLSWDDWQMVYGTDDTAGSRAAKMAFFGEGLPGYGGAGAVLSYRFGTTTGQAASKATVVLNKVGPAAVATLTAKYEGTNANSFTITVRTNALNASYQDLVIYDGTVAVEQYTFATTPADNTPVADLIAQINTLSSYFTGTVTVDGTAPMNVANVPVTGGNDGGTLVAGDWTAMLDAVSGQRFAVFAPFNNSDTAVQASIDTWVKGLNTSGKRVMSFSGGALGETITTALARQAAANSENINTIYGSVVDDTVVGTGNAPVTLSSSQLVPRVAGIFAARGAAKPLTFARLAGTNFSINTSTGTVGVIPPSDSEIVKCLQSGVIPLSRDSNPASPIRLEKGITTYGSTNTDPVKPYAIYKNTRFVKIMQDFEMAIVEFAEREVITPGLPLTQATKEFVIGRAQEILSTMALAGLIQSGWQVGFDSTLPQNPSDDFLALTYLWYFTRSVEQVRNTIVVA